MNQSRALIAVVVTVAACTSPRAPIECERAVPGIDAHLGAGRVAWFGEIHGTEESPRFVGDVACRAAQLGPVQLGLEIPAAEQARLDGFLRDGDRAALLEGSFWRQHDGRSSVAMLALLDRARALRQRGARLTIVAFDTFDFPDRDRAMADIVVAKRDARATFVGLSGNIHSRRTTFRDSVPMVAHLIAAKLPVTTFNVEASGGTFWGCISDDGKDPVCGEHTMHEGQARTPWTLGPSDSDAHDGVYHVGDTKASPPAKP